MRKLLPYEYQLIESLGITKEEYFKFIAIQQEYKDPKVGTALDIRNAGVDPGTVALVLTVVGTLFQVGAALLAPKPEIPGISDRRRRNRQQRFAPSYGFNSTQDLAAYGDPVNLVYTNENPIGDVRVNGSLVWSAIENLGATQFMQLMLVIGASNIKQINYKRIAFGQKALESFGKSHFFVFGKEYGEEGIPLFSDLRAGHEANNFYPNRLIPASASKPACSVHVKGEKAKSGYSQAYTPTTSTSLGVFDSIPINVEVLNRNKKGKPEGANIGIKYEKVGKNDAWLDKTGTFNEGDSFELLFRVSSFKDGDRQAASTASDLRRQMAEALDYSSTYILGSARFRLTEITGSNLEAEDVTAKFKCIETGSTPGTLYGRQTPKTDDPDLRKSIENAVEILKNEQVIVDENGEPVEGEPAKRQLSEEGNIKTPFTVVSESSPTINIKYNEIMEIGPWTSKFQIKDNDNDKIVEEYPIDNGPYYFDNGGSTQYSIEQKEAVGDNMPEIPVVEVRRELNKQISALKKLVGDVNGGKFDGDHMPTTFYAYRGYYSEGDYDKELYYGTPPVETFNRAGVRSWRLENTWLYDGDKEFKLVGYTSKETGGRLNMTATVPNEPGKHTHLTFMYQNRKGIFHLFNFNGLARDDVDNAKAELFRQDQKLRDYRDTLNKRENDLGTYLSDLFGVNQSLTGLNADAVRTGDLNVLNKDSAQTLLAGYDANFRNLSFAVSKVEERIQDRVDSNYDFMHKFATDVIEDDILYLESLLEQLPTKDQEDRVGKKYVRGEIKKIIRKKQEADLPKLEWYLDNWDDYRKSFDNSFFSKCLVKAERAAYDTISECRSVKFSLKARLFRRISGRQKKYAETKVDQYSESDNGVKSRMTFFRVHYKKRDGGMAFTVVPIVFAIRRGSDADFYTQLEFLAATSDHYSFEFEPVHDIKAEYATRGFEAYAFMDNSDKIQTYRFNRDNDDNEDNDDKFTWFGRTVLPNEDFAFYPNEDERGPYGTNEWDMFSVNSDTQIQFSFESGPELTLTAVNEQQLDDSIENKYKNMTMLALGIYAGRGVQDLRSVSVLVKKGKQCRTVENPGSPNADSTSWAPDIFVDTMLDPDNGIGKYVSIQNIDIESLKVAKKFCNGNNLPQHFVKEGEPHIAMNLFMDGVIADPGSWREFWVNNAPFSLLELARKNGKDTLVPALPVNEAGLAVDNNGVPVEVPISALFTSGNILEGSYKEEFLNYGTATEDLIASVIYRSYQGQEIFPTNRSVQVKRNDASSNAIRETFDASQFITQKEQAIMFGKLLCNQRRWIRKGIEFQTFPSEALIEPGDFIYVDVGLKNWDSFSSGRVMEGGVLNTPLNDRISLGTYNFLLYNINTGNTTEKTFEVTEDLQSEGVTTIPGLAEFVGSMFVMGVDKPSKRVYRVTEIAIEEEGEISIKAIEYPCFLHSDNPQTPGTPRAHIADFRAGDFKVS